MAHFGTVCDSADVPTPEYRVQSVTVAAANRLRARTEVEGDAALFVEQGDALNPESWSLVAGAGAPTAPRVVRSTLAQVGTSRVFLLDLDTPLLGGKGYLLALQPWARSRYGQATKTDPIAFVAPLSRAAAGITARDAGADIALPIVADDRGDLVRIDRAAALRARLLLLVSSRRGSFGFASMATFGRGVEPKRTYGPSKLMAEAVGLKAALLLDPDVREASVDVRELDGGAVVFDIEAIPIFDGGPVGLQHTIVAGSEP